MKRSASILNRLFRSSAPGARTLVILAAVLCLQASIARADTRVFEMRVYTANDGKLADLHTRFRDHTNSLFVKHGMSLIGYWTPADAPDSANTLLYILAYPSREAREASWKAFMNDPAWKAAYEASIKNGKLVKKVESKFLNPTDYSPIR